LLNATVKELGLTMPHHELTVMHHAPGSICLVVTVMINCTIGTSKRWVLDNIRHRQSNPSQHGLLVLKVNLMRLP